MSNDHLTVVMTLLAIIPGFGLSLIFLSCGADTITRTIRSRRTLIMLSALCGLEIVLQLVKADVFYKLVVLIGAMWWFLFDLLVSLTPLLMMLRFVRL